MANVNLEKVFQFLNLLPANGSNQILIENEGKYKNILNFLRFLSKLMTKLKHGVQEGLLDNDIWTTLNLNELKGNIEHSLIDINTVLTSFRSRLFGKIDPNAAILDLFNICLLYLINMIYDENKSASVILSNFMDFKNIIFVFTQAPVLLESKSYKNLVTLFVSDLLKLLTSYKFSVDEPQQVKVQCVISNILIEISKVSVYRDIIQKLILKKLNCLLSYFSTNEDFNGLTCSDISSLEFLMYTTKTILQSSPFYGDNFDASVDLHIKQVVDDLHKLFKDKVSVVFINILDDIMSLK